MQTTVTVVPSFAGTGAGEDRGLVSEDRLIVPICVRALKAPR